MSDTPPLNTPQSAESDALKFYCAIRRCLWASVGDEQWHPAPANYKVAGIRFSDQKAFFAAATVIHYLLDKTGLPHRWKEDLEQIFARHPGVDIADLGFPKNWQTSPGWARH